MKTFLKICSIAKSLDQKKFYKFADTLENVLQSAFRKNVSIDRFLELTERMNKITQYKIASLLNILGCTEKEISNAIEKTKLRYVEIMYNPQNLEELTTILEGGVYDTGTRKDNRLDIEHSMEIIENWLVEDAVKPYFHRLTQGGKWEANAFDKDRVLNLSKGLKPDMDFIDKTGQQYEMKTRWGGDPSVPIDIKPGSLPDEGSNDKIYFADIGALGKREKHMPSKFKGSIYDVPVDELRQQPLISVPSWGGKKGHQFDLSKIAPLKSQSLSSDRINRQLMPHMEDWTQGPEYLKKNKIK